MSTKRSGGRRARSGRAGAIRLEVLEGRTLLSTAAETFTGPDLTGLIALAHQGQDTAPAGINQVVQALESQLTSGPLADLTGGSVDGNGFVAEVQTLESSYEQYADQQLLPEFPNVNQYMKLQGQRIVADMISLNEQSTVGLISSSDAATDAQTVINSLTGGPIFALNTPLSAFVTTTTNFETDLMDLAQSLSTGASPALTVPQVTGTLVAEANAYVADIYAGLKLAHPNVSDAVATAVINLGVAATKLDTTSNANAQTELESAITTFDDAVLDKTGVFGPAGDVSSAVAAGAFTPNGTAVTRSATTLSSVSGTAAFGGTASITATLTSQATSQPLSGAIVNFTLDGAYVGTTTTNSSGVATLTGVPTSDSVGTDSGGIVASYSGAFGLDASSASGDLTVAPAATSLSAVSGTATFGGTASLTATLTSQETSQGISGATVSFTLDGTSVGTATTNSSGVATLTGVTTTDDAGTDTGGVVASFSGDTDYAAASNATGNLVVSQAATTLASVSGTATFGGTASLTATLTSQVTSAGIDNETVDFTLDGTSVGKATTNSSGVATLTGVTTTDDAGTHSDDVVASFAGDTNYLAAANASGDLVVSQAATTLASVSGTATFGGTATLTATLTSQVTNAGIANETVDFTLDGTSVGHATTNSSGVATLTDVTTTDSAGTHAGSVVASFAGDSNYKAATNASGDLVVSQAATTLASVSGTATFGGTATLMATLTSQETNAGIDDETVGFTLNNTSVGSIATNSSGVATLSNLTITEGAGTYPIVASFVGDTNYKAAADADGNLVVSQAGTTMSAVSGTGTGGGTMNLTATLTSKVTDAGIANETVTFDIKGQTGTFTATTGNNGVASLTDVPTTLASGSYTITASFAGDSNYLTAESTGMLTLT
jgi:hypothetical protein